MPSAAEPAHPEHTVTGPPGNIIHLGRRRTTRTGLGRRTPQPSAPEPAAASTPQQRLAETAEAFFLASGTSLTDESTAAAYRTTLTVVQLMLDGSLAQSMVGDAEHKHLSGMIAGLRDAPDHL
ncbi:hypothetical protein [Streptomyces halstedii]|uniref:hypothetical protein n=1 Tax=Streptomyces halstedii TaxID=1944 RepID=UPI003810B5C0